MNEFKPTRAMSMAKARMYKWLSDHPTQAIENLTMDAMEAACRTQSISTWMAGAGFPEWWYEKSTALTKVAAGVDIAVERLLEIVSSPIQSGKDATITAKDVLAAADKLFQLADLYPKKKVVERFLDKRLEAMDAEETASETKRLESKLQIANKENS
jgi:hypothetical protein